MRKNHILKILALILALTLCMGSASANLVRYSLANLNNHRNIGNPNSKLTKTLEKISSYRPFRSDGGLTRERATSMFLQQFAPGAFQSDGSAFNQIDDATLQETQNMLNLMAALVNQDQSEYHPCGMHPADEPGEHGLASCRVHYKCAPGEHTDEKAECGIHYECEPGEHTTMADCGVHRVCVHGDNTDCLDEEDNIAAHCDIHPDAAGAEHLLKTPCGVHYMCEPGDHNSAFCGEHYECEPGDHTSMAGCGVHFICVHGGNKDCQSDADGVSLVSGGMVNTNAEMVMAPCGMHPAGAEGDHDMASCGVHFQCEAGKHTDVKADCGVHFRCEPGNHAVQKAPCGEHPICVHGDNRDCQSEDDNSAAHCDIHPDATGSEHSTKTICGVHFQCEPDYHTKAPCGKHFRCEPGNHSNQKDECGIHYKCEPGDHSSQKHPCGEHFRCEPGIHASWKALCGEHPICVHGDNKNCQSEEDNSAAHCDIHPDATGAEHFRKIDCGVHFQCEPGEHRTASCGVHYMCEPGDHNSAFCGEHYECEPGNHTTMADCLVHPICVHGDNRDCPSDADGVSLVSGGMVNTNAEIAMAPCGMHPAGESGEHGEAKCGVHYKCEPGEHGINVCGVHFRCEAGEHRKYAACGVHFECEPGNHTEKKASCGVHYRCEAGDHTSLKAPCGEHRVCVHGDNKDCLSDAAHCDVHPDATGSEHSIKTFCDIHYRCEPGEHRKYAACGEHLVCVHGNNRDCPSDADGVSLVQGGMVNTNAEMAMAPCGMHPADAAGIHSEASCGLHFECEAGKHGKGSCGLHFQCEPGDHGINVCGVHFRCEAGKHRTASCGVHYWCEPGEHSVQKADCGEHYKCEAGDHTTMADCGEHPICVHGDNRDCLDEEDNSAAHCDAHPDATGSEHSIKTFCDIHYRCEPGEHDNFAPCGVHFMCEPGEHSYLADCFVHYRCEPGDHSNLADCGEHPVCVHGNNTDCLDEEDNIAAHCDIHPDATGAEHLLKTPCGVHYMCEPGDHSDEKALCGLHYECEPGDHSSQKAKCGVHYKCEPGDHSIVAPCGEHPVCVHGTNTDCQRDDSAGMFIGLFDDGTIFAGVQYNGGVMAVVGEGAPADNEAGQADQPPVSGVNFVQYATDGNDIYGSSDPSVAMVTPNGDIAVMGSGSVSLGTFDPQGNSVACWNMISDGENLDYAPMQAISLNGAPVSSITMQLGDTAQLGVVEVDGGNGMIESNRDRLTEGQMQPEDVTARESSIRDTDMADEITAYTKNNILVQASQSMLAQANAVPQGVLQMLE